MKVLIEWNGQQMEVDPEHRVLIFDEQGTKTAMLYMPGLPCPVQIRVSGTHYPVWGWNGDRYNPTFSPSILTRLPWGEDRQEIRNHVFVKNGIIQYLSDCTHELAGKSVELPKLCDWPEDMKLWDE